MYTKHSSLLCRLLAALACLTLFFSVLAVPALAEDVSDENLFNKRDKDFREGYNFIQSTEQITTEPDSFITGYIAVNAGDVVSLNLHSTKDSSFIKYALFDTDKNWIDTVRTNSISEITVRIFQAGYIRFSVFGLEFEETITILLSAGREITEEVQQESVLTTSNNTNIVVRTTDEDLAQYFVDRFDRMDPDYIDQYNFVYETEEIVEDLNSFITGYIPVSKGDIVLFSLNSERKSPFIKYALYNRKKEWIATKKLFLLSDVKVEIAETGFIRFSANGRMFKNTASVYVHPATTLYADTQVSEVILPTLTDTSARLEAFNAAYLSNEEINLFNTSDEDFLMNQGYRQLTDTIVEDAGSFMTGYIPVVKGQVVIVNIGAESSFAKYALFDQNKNWLGTNRVDNPTTLIVPVEETGYFRFHGRDNAINATRITIPSVAKLDIDAISGDISARLKALEAAVPVGKPVDVVLFMGQSNMAGRGEVTDEHPEDAPAVIDGAGWEFRAVSDPTKLYPIEKTFGLRENVPGAIDDGSGKTGGLVPAFVNAYYTYNGSVPMVAVSASEGRTSISDWAPGTPRLADAISRLAACVSWLNGNGYQIRHQYMVWCQGENDSRQSEAWYISSYKDMMAALKAAGIEKSFVIRTGNTDPVSQDAVNVMLWQNHLCQDNRDIVMISLDLATMQSRGMMKDIEHYYQDAYNECGEDAGTNMAYYTINGKEPMMFDQQFNEMYYSHVN